MKDEEQNKSVRQSNIHISILYYYTKQLQQRIDHKQTYFHNENKRNSL